MIELPDDELDKLFRKSSEELDPTYEPDDWNDLQKRLDQQDGRTPAGWWRKWWPLGVLALLIPAGIALYSWYGGKEAAMGKVPAAVRENGGTEKGGRGAVRDGAAGEPAGVENADTKKETSNKLSTSEKEAGKSSSISDLNAASAKSSPTLPRSRSKAGGVYLEPIRSKVEGGDGASFIARNTDANRTKSPGRKTPPAQATRAQSEPHETTNAGNAGNAGHNNGVVTEEKGENSIAPVSASAQAAQPGEPARTLISASALNGKSLKWNALLLPGIFAPVQIAPLEEPEEARPPKHSDMSADDRPLVAFRFGYSPDLSTVGLKNFSKPGTAVSLLAEYSFLPRFYLQSGAVWSRKDYYAAADAYELPKIPHYYPPEMTSVDGICNVLEVPLNLRYDVALGERSRWFATGGFSSYHMNSERYKYYFVNESDPNIKYRGWKGNTGWYWFSHANVSAGYEYRISRKLSLLAEPSIRMPLKRVGYGKVNLITTGLWLSVRYTPVFK